VRISFANIRYSLSVFLFASGVHVLDLISMPVKPTVAAGGDITTSHSTVRCFPVLAAHVSTGAAPSSPPPTTSVLVPLPLVTGMVVGHSLLLGDS